LIGFSCPLKAQLIDSFNVVADGKSQSETNSYNYQVISCEAAELLVAQGCILEAAIMYSELIVQYHFVNDAANLDKACRGLFRTQFMTAVDSQYTEKLKLCRPEIIASLPSKRDWEPMFITPPIFKPNDEWLNSATPGVAYKVSVQFDIDEWGNPYNFDFNADDKFLLRYPVIDSLKKARYVPAVKNGKAVKKSKNLVEVVFCLDIGTTCVN
jgi:hypothetical protein